MIIMIGGHIWQQQNRAGWIPDHHNQDDDQKYPDDNPDHHRMTQLSRTQQVGWNLTFNIMSIETHHHQSQ